MGRAGDGEAGGDTGAGTGASDDGTGPLVPAGDPVGVSLVPVVVAIGTILFISCLWNNCNGIAYTLQVQCQLAYPTAERNNISNPSPDCAIR